MAIRDAEKNGITRRDFGRLGLGFAVAAGGIAAGARRAFAQDEAMVTEVPESAAIVQALGYVAKSPNADKNCANCALYLGGDAPKGKCGLFQKGLVSAEGYCNSWSAKSS